MFSFRQMKRKWIDQHKQIALETRKDLLTNKLVMVIRSDSSAPIDELADLSKAPFARIALADPKAVPAEG